MNDRVALTNEAVFAELEGIIDKGFEKDLIPSKIRDISAWYLLTVAEDLARFSVAKDAVEFKDSLLIFFDQLKYSLKHSLLLVLENSENSGVKLPEKVYPLFYRKSSALIMAGLEYERLHRIVLGCYENRVKVELIDGVYEVKNLNENTAEYVALEYLNHGKGSEVDMFSVFVYLMQDENKDNDVVKSICRNTRIKKRKPVYEYTPASIKMLLKYLPQRDEIIPRDFKFPWGDGFETLCLINALWVRCAFHVLSVHCKASEKNIKGGMESSILLKINKKQLIRDIDIVASVGDDKIEKFVDSLTYGFGVKTPDPALQPIYSTGSGALLIPSILLMTSNCQRNALSLSARLDKKLFDRSSRFFEIKMVEHISEKVSHLGRCFQNRHYSANGDKEEVDLVVLDSEEKFCLIIEMRWMIQPGDYRELVKRQKVCDEKVVQVERKKRFFNRNKVEVMGSLVANETRFNDYRFEAIVLVMNYGGKQSIVSEIPVVNSDIFEKLINNENKLAEVYETCRSLSWLPKEGEDFEYQTESFEVGGETIRSPAFTMNINADEYASRLRQPTVNRVDA
ncbi:hypothetical protein [Salinicola socius]|nr:hypothetical protein [Salinicola socius]